MEGNRRRGPPGGQPLRIVAILGPFDGVVFNVFPNLAVIALVADHVFVKRALPNVVTDFPIHEPLQRSDHIGNRRGPATGSSAARFQNVCCRSRSAEAYGYGWA